MKKVLSLILALLLMLSLSACGGSDTKKNETTAGNANSAETAEQNDATVDPVSELPAEFVGTWNLMPEIVGIAYGRKDMTVGQTSLEKEDAIQSFTVSADGKITVDGTEYLLSNVSESDKENYTNNKSNYMDYVDIDSEPNIEDIYSVIINGELYTLLTVENSNLDELIYFEPRGNLVAQYHPLYTKKAVKTIELSLDNWQEIFEPRINYSLNKNDWGDITGVNVNAGLYSKDGITILGTQDARIEGIYQFTDYATIHFDHKTEEYTLADMTGYEDPHEYSFDQELYSRGINFNSAYSETLDITDSEITAKVDSDIYVEVKRIRGTITYIQ